MLLGAPPCPPKVKAEKEDGTCPAAAAAAGANVDAANVEAGNEDDNRDEEEELAGAVFAPTMGLGLAREEAEEANVNPPPFDDPPPNGIVAVVEAAGAIACCNPNDEDAENPGAADGAKEDPEAGVGAAVASTLLLLPKRNVEGARDALGEAAAAAAKAKAGAATGAGAAAAETADSAPKALTLAPALATETEKALLVEACPWVPGALEDALAALKDGKDAKVEATAGVPKHSNG